MTLTPSQRAAIEHPLEDACVVASAGSGKTTVLTGRFVHLVRTYGKPARRIAALTFTEKAAAEMRRRIAEELDGLGDEAARTDVEFAPVSTIHSFCARLLRTHAVEAGVDPAFTVLDETDSWLLRDDATILAERRLRETSPKDVFVLPRIGLSRDDLAVVFERMRGFGLRPEDLRWKHAPSADVAGARRSVLLAAEVYEREGAPLPGEHREALREAAVAARTAAAPGAAPGRVAVAADLVKSLWLKRGRPGAWVKARTALQEALDALEGAILDDLGREEILPALVRVLTAVGAAYEERKREQGALDFTDLEVRTLALLERMAAKGRRLTAAPAALLVDEYQDTSPLQARILERLRGPGTTQFAVGDPKQSIYRFRRADVRVIAAERTRVGERNRRSLPETFRASEGLVDVLNHVHGRLLDGSSGGIAYEPMRTAGTFRPGSGPDVDIAVVRADGNVDEGRRQEAAWLARYLRDLVAARVPRTKVEPHVEGRAIRYGDVAILFRARTALEIYEDALAEAGVPYVTHKGRGYFRVGEIADLLHVLRVVHDPADRFAFAAFATGPALGARDGDLLRWFADPRGPWEALCEEARAGGPFASPVRTMLDLRREAVAGRLGTVVEGALHRLGLLDVALLLPDGERRAANLRKAMETARAMEGGGRHGLDDFLRRLSLLRDREVAEAEATLGGEDDDRVRLMTVHAAKGLEFPVVVLADAARGAPGISDPVLLDGDGTIGTKIVDPLEGDGRRPSAWVALHDEEAKAQQEEALRLLYVATTRAEERLVVTFAEGDREARGWAGTLREALGIVAWGDESRTIGTGRLRVQVIFPEDAAAPEVAPEEAEDVLRPEALAQARTLLEAADAPAAPLGGTRYVVSVSELLGFAEDPGRYRLERLLPPAVCEDPGLLSPDAEAPDDRRDGDPDGGRRTERRLEWDEPATEPDGLDRTAVGRAVHASIERWSPGGDLRDVVERAIADEFGAEPPEQATAIVRAMVERFVRSGTGRRLAEAISKGDDARREVAFHARIKFPARRTVGPFDALLVKGSIDLWLPPESASGGVWIVDHKTNAPSAHARTPEDLARRYSWQLRLYALAAERIAGTDVAGAHLLLLDPGWGLEPLEVPIDVSGPALEEARRLCEAFALAELEDRWPSDWTALLRDR